MSGEAEVVLSPGEAARDVAYLASRGGGAAPRGAGGHGCGAGAERAGCAVVGRGRRCGRRAAVASGRGGAGDDGPVVRAARWLERAITSIIDQ